MKPFRLAGLFTVSFAFWSLLPAQAPTADEAAQTKELKITVVDAATKQPVAGAEVAIYGREPVKVITDTSGAATLPVRTNPPMPEKDTIFSFAVKSPHHESRHVEWFSDTGHVRE